MQQQSKGGRKGGWQLEFFGLALQLSWQRLWEKFLGQLVLLLPLLDVAGSPLISIQEVVRGTFTSGDHFGNMCSAQLCAICRAKSMMKGTEMSSRKLINKILQSKEILGVSKGTNRVLRTYKADLVR